MLEAKIHPPPTSTNSIAADIRSCSGSDGEDAAVLTDAERRGWVWIRNSDNKKSPDPLQHMSLTLCLQCLKYYLKTIYVEYLFIASFRLFCWHHFCRKIKQCRHQQLPKSETFKSHTFNMPSHHGL